MITLLDCIHRIPQVTDSIIADRDKTFAPFFEFIGPQLAEINQIILIGSGTSNTCSVTARGFMEKTSGIQTLAIIPNSFLDDYSAYNPKALYIFTSQSGTSHLTRVAAQRMKAMGCWTVSMTEHDQTPIARDTGVHVSMGCGHEEYGMRTIGYCSSVLTLMLLGLEIGRRRHHLQEEEAKTLLDHARQIAVHHRQITDQTMAWFDRNAESLMAADTFCLYGAGPLWGVTLEGALKILEISKRKIAIGYELDDGMHGPTMGFTKSTCVLILNDGRNAEQARQLAVFAKKELHSGRVIGLNTMDDEDLPITALSDEFRAIEYAAAVQVLAYRLAVDYGIDLADNSQNREGRYFSTHEKPAA